ncbi:MAG: acyltransferase [Puia sp.]
MELKYNRLGYIDTLRGLAALYVVIFHIIRIPYPILPYPLILHPIFDIGFTGVTLFFIVSAFTLCLTLDGRTAESHWIPKFYFRRAARILPLYYVWLATMAVYEFGPNIIHQKWPLFSFTFFLYNFQVGLQKGIVPASWTLGVEMIFYLIFPFLFMFANNLKKASLLFFPLLIISFIHFHYTDAVPDYEAGYSLFHQLPVFCLGIMTYWLYKNYLPGITKAKQTAYVFFAGFFIIYFISAWFRTPLGKFIICPLAVAYSFLLLGLSLMHRNPIVNRVSIFLGLISYSLYLNHPRVIVILKPVYRIIYGWHIKGFLMLPICIFVTLILLVPLSWLTYLLIEKPGSKLIKYISKKVFIAKEFPVTDRLIQLEKRN